MASFAESHKVIRCVSAGLTGFYVMHIKYGITGFTLTATAFMTVPEQYILSYIPESKLLAFLVVRALRNGFALFLSFEQLGIELGYLYGYPAYRKDSFDSTDVPQVRPYLVLDRWCEPSFLLGLGTVKKFSFTISSFPVASCPAKLMPSGKFLHDVVAKFKLSLKQYLLFCGSG